jgi:hypothetical protein
VFEQVCIPWQCSVVARIPCARKRYATGGSTPHLRIVVAHIFAHEFSSEIDSVFVICTLPSLSALVRADVAGVRKTCSRIVVSNIRDCIGYARIPCARQRYATGGSTSQLRIVFARIIAHAFVEHPISDFFHIVSHLSTATNFACLNALLCVVMMTGNHKRKNRRWTSSMLWV